MKNNKAKIAKRMEKKEVRETKRQEKLQQKVIKLENASKFKRWRNERPFWGATLTLLAGIVILYIPVHLYAIAFIPGSFVFVGFLFGGLILITGVLSYIYPQFSTVFGIVTIFLSVLSIMGALGGFVIGTILGIIGGAFNVAWEKQEIDIDRRQGKVSTKQRKSRKNEEAILEETKANIISLKT